MMSNYPAGVTGNEWQIAGCDEYDGYRLCGDCDEWAVVDIQCGDFREMWDCPLCEAYNEADAEV